MSLAAPDEREPLVWSQSFDLPIGESGRSEPFVIEPPATAGSIVVRVRGAGGAPLLGVCPILEEVVASGQPWVAPLPPGESSGFFCVDCRHRVHLGFGGGLFAFPNDGTALPANAVITGRISLRDCLSRLEARGGFNRVPERVQVDVGTVGQPTLDSPGTLRLRVGLAASDESSLATAEAESFLAAAVAEAAAVLEQVNIRLVVAGVHRLARPEEPRLRYGPGNYSALNGLVAALWAAAGPESAEPEVPVLLVPCLEWSDVWTGATTRPAGHVPRIPGGYGDGEGDGVFLRMEGCGPLDANPHWESPERLGRALAHELGHYLGLYHVVETLGGEDHLADTHPSEPNLMQPGLGSGAGAASLSEHQAAVVRAHPYVTYGVSPP